MRRHPLFWLPLIVATNAFAFTVVPTSELPGDIQSCFQSTQCISPYYSGGEMVTALDAEGVAAFQYTQQGVNKWLLRYELFTPPGTVGGVAWLSAQNSYDIAGSDAHDFTLYFDGSPAFLNAPPYTLTLNDTDLADGSAFQLNVPDFEFPDNSILEGNLGMSPPLRLCLATGCGGRADFNLVHLDYLNGLFAFDASDSRSLLFSEGYWYVSCGAPECGDFSQTQSLYVNAVPVPATLPLFLSGLVAGAGLLRRRRAVE